MVEVKRNMHPGTSTHGEGAAIDPQEQSGPGTTLSEVPTVKLSLYPKWSTC